jgi:CelD/BcsL family acetyltransferase involved in cellulose biosynthesis
LASIISRQFDGAARILAPAGRDEVAGLEDYGRTRTRKSPELEARCITTLQELEALRTDWQALEAACNDSSLVFQSHDWCSAWAATFLDDVKAPELCIATVRQSGKLIAVLPAMICVGSGPRILRVLSEPFAQYGGLLCHPARRTDAVLDAIFNAIKSHGGVDVIYLRHVREDNVAARFAARHLSPSGYRETAPFMDLSAFTGDEDYQGRYTKVQRRRRKKIASAIGKLGEISFTAHKSGADYEELLRCAVGNKQVWIAERGLISLPLAHPKLVDFLLALGGSAARAGLQPVVTSLKAGERCISYELGFR